MLIIFGTAWALRSHRRWDVLSVSALLLSPLGWIYYLPVGFGPIMETLRHAPPLVLVGLWLMFVVPFAALASGAPYQGIGTVLFGCWYTWAMLALWLALTRAEGTLTQGGAQEKIVRVR
jgi:hypothetical protein